MKTKFRTVFTMLLLFLTLALCQTQERPNLGQADTQTPIHTRYQTPLMRPPPV